MGKRSRAKLQRLLDYRVCPGCGREFANINGFGDEGVFEVEPEALEYAVCPKCTQILRFDQGRELRLPSARDLDELKGKPELRQALFLMRRALGILATKLGPVPGIFVLRGGKRSFSLTEPTPANEEGG